MPISPDFIHNIKTIFNLEKTFYKYPYIILFNIKKKSLITYA